MRRIADGLAWLRGGTASATPALRALAELADPAARLLFDGDGQPRALLDRELHLVRANTALAGLLGEALGDALGELLAPDAPAAAEQAVGAVRAVATAIAHGAPPAGLPTAMLRTADGAPRPVQLALALVREADGSTSGAIVTFAPAAGTADTQARRHQAVGVLAGGVAHDFNNLLQAVIGAAESLSERPALSAAAREEVGLILQGARRGARLVRQLLAFAARQTLQPRVVAVNAVVADLAPLLRHSLGERVRLELALEEPGRFVRVDAGELDQVLLNLVMNARTAMPRGGTLHLRTGRLTLLAARAQQGAAGGSATIPPGRYVTIEVQDTGTGIPPDILPRIFEPFFTTRPDSGTGLGLASVAGIVRQSGGFIEVTTAAGQGSCFRILLPRSPEPATRKAAGPTANGPTAREPAPAARPTRPATVLLAEDEDAVRRLAQRALTRQGWQVLAADSGEAALELIAQGAIPDCIVSDMVMPGIDGAALVQAVRARLGQPSLPAIIVSGYAAVPQHDAIGAAATVFLPKPYALRALVGQVADLLAPMPATGAPTGAPTGAATGAPTGAPAGARTAVMDADA